MNLAQPPPAAKSSSLVTWQSQTLAPDYLEPVPARHWVEAAIYSNGAGSSKKAMHLDAKEENAILRKVRLRNRTSPAFADVSGLILLSQYCNAAAAAVTATPLLHRLSVFVLPML